MGYDSPSIIRYLEPSIGDVFTTRFADCHFNENLFPPLGGEKSVPEEQREITWNASIMSHFDLRTNQSELEKDHSFAKSCKSITPMHSLIQRK